MEKRQNKYQIQHEARQNQILSKARGLFLQRGIDSVKMIDIADACGISRQTLYKYFESIDAVIFAVQERVICRFSLRDERDLEGALRHLFDYYQKNREDFFFISMFDVYVHTHKIDKALITRYHTAIHQFFPKIRLEALPAGGICGVPAEKYVAVAIHSAWALLTRMMILGDEFTVEYHLTEEESFQILCRTLCKDFSLAPAENFEQTISGAH